MATAYYSFVPVEPQDAFNASSVTTPLNALKTAFANLKEISIREGAFGPQHIPSFIPVGDISQTIEYSGSVGGGADPAGVHTGSDMAAVWAMNTLTGTAHRLTASYPYLTDSAWTVLEGGASSEWDQRFIFTAHRPLMTASPYNGGFLVLANCNFVRFVRNEAGSEDPPIFLFGAFCIQIYVNTLDGSTVNAWRTWPGSVRMVSEKRLPHVGYLQKRAEKENKLYGSNLPGVVVTNTDVHNTALEEDSNIDVSIRTLIDPTSLGNMTISGIRFAAASWEQTLDASGGYNNHQMVVHGANMTVLPIHAEDKGSG